ncbi:MAG: hypothetical protein COX48_05660 [bacterium (Candidatus Stahlbacteria) CG23_combo_of_CG06-09_8_20_14_all_34_7]|nr:MAG: hypothetical protein COX48_05660 [bacterium (Candidatus Stahlbacteria) CG23_combo_of_CG06-09_8_20_14_all_34_7]
MSKAVSNFDFDVDAINKYFVPLLEVEDRKNLFKKDYGLWFDFLSLIIEALRFYSDDSQIDFKQVFDDLNGKVPYNGRRKRMEREGSLLIFSLFSDSVTDYLFNLKIDPGRRLIIRSTVAKFKDDSKRAIIKLLE